MPVISVIIPIYNVATYLRQCIDSVIEQDIKEIEIILVNDGSTDESLSICQQYKEKNSNITLIEKENGGLSDARNKGVSIVKGEYIFFLDGDDWLAPDALHTLYEYATNEDCDVVQGGIYYAYSNRLLTDDGGTTAATTLSRTDTMRELLLNKRIKNFAWGKLYKAEIVKRHPFPVGKYFEDSYWQHLIVHETTRYGIVPTPLYYYRQRTDSISGTLSAKGLDLLKGQEERLRFVRKEYPELIGDMLRTYLHTTYTYLLASDKVKDKATKGLYANYWQRMTGQYGEEMEQVLGSEYTCLRNVVRWHLATTYDLIVRAKNRVKHVFLK